MMAASMMVTVLWKYGDDDCCFSSYAMMASGRLPSTLRYHAELFDSEALCFGYSGLLG